MSFKSALKALGGYIKDSYSEWREHQEEEYERYTNQYERYDEDDLRREYRLHKADILRNFGRRKAFAEALESHGLHIDSESGEVE